MAIGISKRYIGIGVLGALVALSWWLQREEQALEQGAVSHSIDYYLKDFSVTFMDDAGLPSRRLHGTSLVHYEDDDSAELQQLKLELAEEQGAEWLLTAGAASLYDGGDRALLKEQVRLQRTVKGEEGGQLEIETPDLWVYPDRERAETESGVVIKSDVGVMRGQGMEINLKQGQVSLLDEVRGKYER